MPIYTFDTSFIISNKLSVYPDNFLFSDVVLLELIGSASDESIFKQHQNTRRIFKEDGKLIIPNADDWLMAGKVLFWLEQGKRKGNRGNAPPKRPGATQRMALDALIAISARRYKAIVVTENFDDFSAIKYYCDFRLMRGAEFLNKKK
jgi:predicted nucleic acid-binding protein